VACGNARYQKHSERFSGQQNSWQQKRLPSTAESHHRIKTPPFATLRMVSRRPSPVNPPPFFFFFGCGTNPGQHGPEIEATVCGPGRSGNPLITTAPVRNFVSFPCPALPLRFLPRIRRPSQRFQVRLRREFWRQSRLHPRLSYGHFSRIHNHKHSVIRVPNTAGAIAGNKDLDHGRYRPKRKIKRKGGENKIQQ